MAWRFEDHGLHTHKLDNFRNSIFTCLKTLGRNQMIFHIMWEKLLGAYISRNYYEDPTTIIHGKTGSIYSVNPRFLRGEGSFSNLSEWSGHTGTFSANIYHFVFL